MHLSPTTPRIKGGLWILTCFFTILEFLYIGLLRNFCRNEVGILEQIVTPHVVVPSRPHVTVASASVAKELKDLNFLGMYDAMAVQ